MKGVVIKKAQIISEDERRKIVSVMNGELNVKDIHILFMKGVPIESGEHAGYGLLGDNYRKEPLGNHKHWYAEVMYVLKGKCHYWLKNKEGETMECDMEEGDLMFRAPEVVHTCVCTPDTILIDGATESWIDDNWNHVPEELIK